MRDNRITGLYEVYAGLANYNDYAASERSLLVEANLPMSFIANRGRVASVVASEQDDSWLLSASEGGTDKWRRAKDGSQSPGEFCIRQF